MGATGCLPTQDRVGANRDLSNLIPAMLVPRLQEPPPCSKQLKNSLGFLCNSREEEEVPPKMTEIEFPSLIGTGFRSRFHFVLRKQINPIFQAYYDSYLL